MKILLLGEYSNVHNTLAEGLRALGHEVCLASNGDFWKNYPRDIDLQRNLSASGTISFMWRLMKALPKMRGYDVVQVINPVFFEMKAQRLFPVYKYLRRHNKKMILGAFGMDYYWVKVNRDEKPLRYSDFNLGNAVRHDEAALREEKDWIGTAKQTLNEYIAHDCDGIVSGLYEYWVTYRQFADKMQFIPFPIKPSTSQNIGTSEKLTIFVGLSKGRSVYKGTDIMHEAAKRLQSKYPEKVEVKVASGVPFDQYQHMMDNSDCILDQLYSYTPAMNALLAMSKGIIVVGGGEEEQYRILEDCELRPIVNVLPVQNETTGEVDFEKSVESCYHSLEQLILYPERIPLLKQQSIEYINRYHDYRKVAQQYLDFWEKC